MSWLIGLLSADCFVLLVRRHDIHVVFKKPEQRTHNEQRMIARGLARSLVLELVIFAPVSVVLIFWLARPYLLSMDTIKVFLMKSGEQSTAFDGLLGIVAYAFPFAAIRRIVREVAINTLTRFAAVAEESASKSSNDGRE